MAISKEFLKTARDDLHPRELSKITAEKILRAAKAALRTNEIFFSIHLSPYVRLDKNHPAVVEFIDKFLKENSGIKTIIFNESRTGQSLDFYFKRDESPKLSQPSWLRKVCGRLFGATRVTEEALPVLDRPSLKERFTGQNDIFNSLVLQLPEGFQEKAGLLKELFSKIPSYCDLENIQVKKLDTILQRQQSLIGIVRTYIENTQKASITEDETSMLAAIMDRMGTYLETALNESLGMRQIGMQADGAVLMLQLTHGV